MPNNSIDKIAATLDFLYEGLSWTQLYYCTIQTMFLATQKGYHLFHNSFFAAAYQAATNETILGLSKLLDEQKDSISFHYMFNLIEYNCKKFPYSQRDKVILSVKTHRMQILEHQTLLVSIKSQRDRILAHSDRKIINQPELLEVEPFIVFDEIQSCLDDLLVILNSYLLNIKDSEYDLTHIIKQAKQDTDYLISIYDQSLSHGKI
jgi:hypothetical protein